VSPAILDYKVLLPLDHGESVLLWPQLSWYSIYLSRKNGRLIWPWWV